MRAREATKQMRRLHGEEVKRSAEVTDTEAFRKLSLIDVYGATDAERKALE